MPVTYKLCPAPEIEKEENTKIIIIYSFIINQMFYFVNKNILQGIFYIADQSECLRITHEGDSLYWPKLNYLKIIKFRFNSFGMELTRIHFRLKQNRLRYFTMTENP